jgi:hypothetical protein
MMDVGMGGQKREQSGDMIPLLLRHESRFSSELATRRREPNSTQDCVERVADYALGRN